MYVVQYHSGYARAKADHAGEDTLSWDAHRYADHVSKTSTAINVEREDELLKTYPPLGHVQGDVDANPESYKIIAEPAVITDCHGKILVWSLPKILSQQRQVRSCTRGNVASNTDLMFRPLSLPQADISKHGCTAASIIIRRSRKPARSGVRLRGSSPSPVSNGRRG